MLNVWLMEISIILVLVAIVLNAVSSGIIRFAKCLIEGGCVVFFFERDKNKFVHI